MRTLLILFFLMTAHFGGLLGQPLTGGDLVRLPNRQVKGMARSALRMADYYQSRVFLQEWHRRDSLNEKVIFKLGYSYFRTREFDRALECFSGLEKSKGVMQIPALFYIGQIQKQCGRYEIAIDAFNSVRRRYENMKPKVSREQIDNEIAGCKLGIACRDTVVNSEVLLMNGSVNGEGMQFGPQLLSDTVFVYGSKQAGAYEPVGSPIGVAWHYRMARKENGVWRGGLDAQPPFFDQPASGTGNGVFSVDGQRYYSSRCERQLSGKMLSHLYVSYKQEAGWSSPVKIAGNVNHQRFSSGQPAVGTCFNPNLEVVYFVSDRPGGVGGQDIWFTLYDKATCKFKKAENAGVYINTRGNESTPFYDLPSHCLLFSSTGWPGIGGYDVFKAKGELVSWEEPENFGVPVNSSHDDLDFVRNASGRFGVFASNRPHGNRGQAVCCDELYGYYQTESPRILVRGRLVREATDGDNIFKQLSGKSADVLPVGVVSGQKLSVQQLADSTSTLFLQETVTNDKGEFEIWVDPNSNYRILVEDSTLLDRDLSFSTKQMDNNQTLEMETVSLNALPQTAIEVKNVFYEFNESELTIGAKGVLDSTLYLLMVAYPQLTVEVGSHTDNRGDSRYNLRLSQRRALSVVAYLVEKGIAANRMTAKGYGESKPIAPNENADGSDNPEGRQKNRRTEFVVTGVR